MDSQCCERVYASLLASVRAPADAESVAQTTDYLYMLPDPVQHVTPDAGKPGIGVWRDQERDI